MKQTQHYESEHAVIKEIRFTPIPSSMENDGYCWNYCIDARSKKQTGPNTFRSDVIQVQGQCESIPDAMDEITRSIDDTLKGYHNA